MSDKPKGSDGGARPGRPSLAERYAGPKAIPAAPAAEAPDPSPPEAAPDGYEAFSTISANRQEIMLELRLLSGNCKALGYSYLVAINFDPSDGLTLEFTGHRVRIKGRNLVPLFRGLAAHRIASIREGDAFADQAADSATVVHSITLEEMP